MKINKRGLDIIKKYEGLSLRSYRCPAGVLTIGYGHSGNDVKPNMTITEDDANRLLRKDVAKFEKLVEKYDSSYRFNENQFSALVSFAYNVGNIDGLTSKGKRTLDVIVEKMLLYCKANGTYLSGLYNRRVAERKLFLQPVVQSDNKGVVIAPSGLNVRTGASVNNRVLTAIPYGYEVDIIDVCNDEWLHVNYDGIDGYVYSRWIRRCDNV